MDANVKIENKTISINLACHKVIILCSIGIDTTNAAVYFGFFKDAKSKVHIAWLDEKERTRHADITQKSEKEISEILFQGGVKIGFVEFAIDKKEYFQCIKEQAIGEMAYAVWKAKEEVKQ